MKKWMLLCILLLSGCGSSNGQYETLTSEQAKDRMNENVVILDVRTLEEYAAGHIEDAVNIPLDAIGEIETQFHDKDVEFLVYCRSGSRSAQASAQLVEMGYTNVYDFGGVQDWPYELVK